MRQLIVGNDLDGVGHVFGDTVKAHLDHTGLGHLWKSGPNPKPYWDFFRDWTKDDGSSWTGADFKKLCDEAADCGCLFNGPVRDGWLEMMDKQAEAGYYIVIITDRPFGSSREVSEKITVEWLRNPPGADHGVYYDELIFSADKTCRWTDFFIDDKIENYDALREAGTNAFLLNRPWNEIPEGDARQRIDTFDEFMDAINTAAEQGFYDQSFA